MRAKLAAALVLSLGIHIGIFAGFGSGEDEVRFAGGGAMEMAALGNDFEDMLSAGGILQPVEGDDQVPPTAAEIVKPAEVEEADRPIETEALKPAESTNSAQRPVAAPIERVTPDTSRHAEPAETAEPVAAALDLEPVETQESRLAALPEAEPVVDLPVLDEAKPVEMASLPPLETLFESLPLPEPNPRAAADAVEETRPQEIEKAEPARAKKIEAAPDKAAKKRETKKPKKVVTQGAGKGNADRDALKGTADGRREATGARSANSGAIGAAQGNAEVSNYPGRVRARIDRTRRRRAGGSGTVVVRFSITGDGGLGSVAIARSSGNSAADKSALEHIRRAAPFPPPPAGAQRTFSVPLTVEG